MLNKQPPINTFVLTKIDDADGVHNEQVMKWNGNLWFCKDNTYVYYSPTHWKNLV